MIWLFEYDVGGHPELHESVWVDLAALLLPCLGRRTYSHDCPISRHIGFECGGEWRKMPLRTIRRRAMFPDEQAKLQLFSAIGFAGSMWDFCTEYLNSYSARAHFADAVSNHRPVG